MTNQRHGKQSSELEMASLYRQEYCLSPPDQIHIDLAMYCTRSVEAGNRMLECC
jgi:hypothetical protein